MLVEPEHQEHRVRSLPGLRIHLQPPQRLRPRSTDALTSGSVLIQRMKRTVVMEHRTVFEQPDVALNGCSWTRHLPLLET